MNIASMNQATSALADEAVGALRQRLRRPLRFATEAGFEEATLLWNAMIDKTPALVVQPTGTADVIAAVDLARDNDPMLSVRGGGHHIAGTALVDVSLEIAVELVDRIDGGRDAAGKFTLVEAHARPVQPAVSQEHR